MHNRKTLLTLTELKERRYTKNGLARLHYKEETYDTALPQNWLNETAKRSEMPYNALLSTIVWLYPAKSQAPRHWLCGMPAVLSIDTAAELDRLNITYFTPTGIFPAIEGETA